MSLHVAYSWSHTLAMNDAMGMGDIEGLPYSTMTRFNVQDFKGLAGYDLRHVGSVAFVYNIPYRPSNPLANAVLGNWQLSGIVMADSSLPYWVMLPDDNENIGWAGRDNEFPNVTCNPEKGITPSITEWFNTACYQVPAYGTAGDAGRKGLTGPHLFDWNQSVSKNWPIGKREGQKLEFRSEFYNLPNNTTFALPDMYAGTADFGELINGVRNGGRTIQFALKIHF